MYFIKNDQKCQEMFSMVKRADFYDAGIKELLPRLTKCIAIHDDYVEK
jgi:hypothetical protein